MNESYEEWLEMVREEDARNRQAFTGERPLTVTEFIHRKEAATWDELPRGRWEQTDDFEEVSYGRFRTTYRWTDDVPRV